MPPPVDDYTDVKRRNAELNLREMREGREELESLPRYLMVELTQGCNLTCPMCRSRSIGVRERQISRPLLSSAAEILFPTAEMIDIRGWGESLLVPDVGDIIDDVARYRARCRVVTNLSINRPALLDKLIEINAMIDVSLDAACQEVLDVARTGARLSLIDRNLRHLAAGLVRRHGSAAALRIVATVQRCTLESLPGLISYAASAGVPSVVLNEVTLSPGDPNGISGLDDDVDAAVAAAGRVARESGVELHAGTRLGTLVGLRKEIPWCIHPWSYAVIGYDGSVGYCDHLIGPMISYSCMGEYAKDGFYRIWNGDPWRALRRWHAAGHRPHAHGPFRACSKCYEHRNVDFEDIFEPRLRRYRL
jgi:MoaA/NifB/PqqE/SkfB family radical SAM enzyme